MSLLRLSLLGAALGLVLTAGFGYPLHFVNERYFCCGEDYSGLTPVLGFWAGGSLAAAVVGTVGLMGERPRIRNTLVAMLSAAVSSGVATATWDGQFDVVGCLGWAAFVVLPVAAPCTAVLHGVRLLTVRGPRAG